MPEETDKTSETTKDADAKAERIAEIQKQIDELIEEREKLKG